MSAEDDFDRLLERSVVLVRSGGVRVALIVLRHDGEIEEITEFVPRHGFTDAGGEWDEAVAIVHDRIASLRAVALITAHADHVKIWLDHADAKPRQYRVASESAPVREEIDHPGFWP